MKNYFRFILYVFIGLIIGVGLLLFIFHSQIFDWLEGSSNLTVNIPGPVATSSVGAVLDLSLLQAPRFTALKDNVVNFDFDNICWRPSVTVVPSNQFLATVPITAASSTAATTTAPVNCVLGNNLPFLIQQIK